MASAGWVIGLKKKKNLIPFDLFWITSQNKTKEVVILDLTSKEELLHEVEDGGAFEDSGHDLLDLFLMHF